MEIGFKVKCVNGNEGISCCSLQFCNKQSIMCENTHCKCRSIHQKCLTNLSIIDIWKRLRTKGRNYVPILVQVYEWYNIQSKKLDVQMIEIQKKIDNSQGLLTKDEQTLFQCLKEGKSEQITALLVNKVMVSLYKEQAQTIPLLSSRIKQSLLIKSEQINNLLRKVKNTIDYQKNNKMEKEVCFSLDLCHNNIQCSQRSIKCVKEAGGYQLSLLQPQIQTNKKFRFRIIKTKKSDIYFGVCQLRGIDFKTNILNLTNIHTVMMYQRNPKSFLFCKAHSNQCVKLQKNQINRVDTNDIVQIQYESQTRHVVFRNITKNLFKIQNKQTRILYNKIDTQPLYFGIMLLNQGDQVQIQKY